jgi:hypothetical protein
MVPFLEGQNLFGYVDEKNSTTPSAHSRHHI